ncbi:Spy/CpxP family protein refolding chaperone [Maribacter polysaccharolyticus]|uniref:Spy/CpxP family protein refolding chaperone n=1 Tax=Maribacter polysaccharolyticus TaxID=3020831 RepID=UPI00237F2128|nr:Spy/CpxP family protein refolding chaperone [Maribacter polysaccharolyticus]MDE3742743.1 Spy/CpxP family protein refolding chaperone [Maribacter polysaccharolyticus]
MKKVIVLVALIVGTTAMAQQRKGNRGNSMKDLTVEQIATLQTKKMTLELDLTEAQQTKIQALNLENATKRKAKMEERKALRDSGERPKLSADEKYALQLERMDAAIAQKASMKKILNDEQYAKWEMKRQKRGNRDMGEGRESKRRK